MKLNIPLPAINNEDNLLFANSVNDFNPIHLSEQAARSSLFGQTIVHGVHGTIRQLDTLFKHLKVDWITPQACLLIKVKFRHAIYKGEEASLSVIELTSNTLKLKVVIDDLTISTINISKTLPTERAEQTDEPINCIENIKLSELTTPLNHQNLNDLVGKKFDISFDRTKQLDLTQAYPLVSAALGQQRLYLLAQLSSLVGMVSPGLYSLFQGFDARLAPEGTMESCSTTQSYRYNIDSFDTRFGLLNSSTESELVSSKIYAIQRPAPINQPSISSIIKHNGEAIGSLPNLKGKKVIVIGGSRGLGATCSRLLAVCGADLTVTYSSSKESAQAVVDDCLSYRNSPTGSESYEPKQNINVQRIDILSIDKDQLEGSETYDHIYYFPTPLIFVRKTMTFDANLFARFNRYYLDGFASCQRTFSHEKSSIFYPSSTAADTDDENTLEYRMSKISGEGLCKVLAHKHSHQRYVVERLPRLESDQTAQVLPAKTHNSIESLANIISQMSSHTE